MTTATTTAARAKMRARMMTELGKAADLVKELRELAKESEELEGTAPMPSDLLSLREEKLAIDAQMDALDARKKDIQQTFRTRLEKDKLVGYTIDRKVKARRSPGTREGIDEKALREKHPKIAAAFKTITPYVSIRIS